MTVKRNTACPSRRTSIFVKNIKIVKYTFFIASEQFFTVLSVLNMIKSKS